MSIRFGLLLILAVSMAQAILPGTAAAAVDPPDAASITGAWAWENVLEAGDQFYLITFDIQYGTDPEGYTATDLIFIRLLSSTNHEYASITPYSYYNNGFAYGVTGFYFTAAQVTSLGLPFGELCGTKVQLNYNPTVSWSSTPSPFTLSTFSSWYSGPSSQLSATIRMRTIAQKLEDEWGGVIDIISGASWSRSLTVYGEDYFTNAIPNLINVCPKIFSSYKDIPEWPDDMVASDCYISGNADISYPVYGTHWVKESWVATSSYDVDWIQLRLGATGVPPSSLIVSLYSSGSPVVSGSISASSLSGGAGWVNVAMNDSCMVSRGNTYEIVIHTSGGSPAASYNVYAVSSGGYPYGTLSVSDNSGAVWTDTGADAVFIVESEGKSSGAYAKGWAHRLDGTPFDLSGAADALGISTMWMRGLIWMLMTVAMCVIVSRGTMNMKPIMFVVTLMTAIGAGFGFYYITFAAFVLFALFIVVVYYLMWEKSSA